MPPTFRAVRAARRVLSGAKSKNGKVDIRKIAAGFAHIVERDLPEDVSGMLVPLETPTQNKAWVIVVNASNPEVRKRFTIAHELGHVVMHRFTKPHADNRFGVRFRDRRSSEGTDFEEVEANQFAAELLMPEAVVLEKVRRRGIDLDYGMDQAEAQEQLKPVAEELGVSQQALSIRLANLAALS